MTTDIAGWRAQQPVNDPSPAVGALLWAFALAILTMVPAQIFRLYQDEPLPWLLGDYVGRLAVLVVMLVLPAARWCLMRPDRPRVHQVEAVLWVVTIVTLFMLCPLDAVVSGILPHSALGTYPHPDGLLYLIDLTGGIALVALHEELVFRKLAYRALKSVLASDAAIVVTSALVFAASHWWTGIGNILMTFLFGLAAMSCYRRTGSLWPIGLAHSRSTSSPSPDRLPQSANPPRCRTRPAASRHAVP